MGHKRADGNDDDAHQRVEELWLNQQKNGGCHCNDRKESVELTDADAILETMAPEVKEGQHKECQNEQEGGFRSQRQNGEAEGVVKCKYLAKMFDETAEILVVNHPWKGKPVGSENAE